MLPSFVPQQHEWWDVSLQNSLSFFQFSPFHFSCPSKSGSFGHNYITSFFDRERESCVTSKKAVVQQVTKLFGIYDSKLNSFISVYQRKSCLVIYDLKRNSFMYTIDKVVGDLRLQRNSYLFRLIFSKNSEHFSIYFLCLLPWTQLHTQPANSLF